VTNDESVATVVKQVIDQFGHIDVLVNNAGVGATGAAEECSIAQTQDIFRPSRGRCPSIPRRFARLLLAD